MDLPIPTTVKAQLISLTDSSQSVDVHFNPASLVYTIENSTKQQSADPKRKQFAAQFSGKLTMDLQFDTTDTGEDVRNVTGKVAMFMQASANAGKNPSSGNAQAQPVLKFAWGSYQFQGTMDSFKETIDFFSADGVPLRSLVSIGLSRQDQVFDLGGDKSKIPVSGSLVPTSTSDSATSAATKGGDPSAARQLGADNGLDSLRSTGGAALQVNAGIDLQAAAAFSVSASVGAGAGLSIGAGAGISIGAGAGISLGAGAGISVGGATGVSFGASAGVASAASLQLSAGVGGGALFGGQASAGVPATAGAFAGLEVGRATVSTTTRLDPLRMLRATTSADVSTDANASFSLGGAASAQAGFSSDVGANFDFSSRLVFDSD
jgi:Contractile injection system tube protein